ncbi:4741_t:CDS:1, partial [Funneliformis geosporum]
RYLEDNKFTIYTDHSALQWLLNQPTKEKDSKRIIRWKIILQQFQFEVKYRKGKANANADTLSRINELQTPNSLESTSITDHG